MYIIFAFRMNFEASDGRMADGLIRVSVSEAKRNLDCPEINSEIDDRWPLQPLFLKIYRV